MNRRDLTEHPRPAQSQSVERVLLVFIIIAHVTLAIGFSLGPIFEGPDEFEHFRYIQYVAENRSLPNAFEVKGTQLHHAPLYYVLMAPFAAALGHIDLSSYDAFANPFYSYAFDVPGNDNKNILLHPQSESFPYIDNTAARNIHLLRLLSVLIDTGTVLACYSCFRELWPDDSGKPNQERRLIALAFVAFQPQFVYLTSQINNDNLLTLTTTITLWLLLRQVRQGMSTKRAIGLGLVLAAAVLAKVNSLFLAIPVGVILMTDRRAWRFAPFILSVVLALSGWWYLRNQLLYGDFTASDALFTATQPSELIDPNRLALDIALTRMPFAYETFWARFGPDTVAVAPFLYDFFDGLVIVTFVGLVILLMQVVLRYYQERALNLFKIKQAVVLTSFIIIWPILLLYFASRAWSGIQGRYLLPGIAGWAVLFALALDALVIPRLKHVLPMIITLLLSAICAYIVIHEFLPAYRPLPPEASPARTVAYQFGETAKLVGVSPEIVRAQPGDTVFITLTWQAIQPTTRLLRTFVHTVDSDVVHRDSQPGTGNLLSTDWLPGEMWSERYVLLIPPDAQFWMAYPLVAGLADPTTGKSLPSYLNGQEVVPYVGMIAINGPIAPFEPEYRFGNVIGLASPHITLSENQLEVCLQWVSLTETAENYHIFVHVMNKDGNVLAQYDAEPRNGNYPTSGWSLGERVYECVTFDPSKASDPPEYINIGLYTWPNGERSPVVNRLGIRQDSDQIMITVPSS